MAGSKTVYLERVLLNFVLGNTVWVPPSTVYVALSSQPFDPTATDGAMNELTGGGYARVAVTNNTTNWPNAADGNPADKSNAIAITWPTATADWLTTYSAYLSSAASGGNLLYGADFTTAQSVVNGQTFTIPIGLWLFQET